MDIVTLEAAEKKPDTRRECEKQCSSVFSRTIKCFSKTLKCSLNVVKNVFPRDLLHLFTYDGVLS